MTRGLEGRKDEVTAFLSVLRFCAKNKDLCRGTRAHDYILARDLLQECSDALVTMYAKCGVLSKARELFDMYNSKDVLTWTSLIAGYAHKGLAHEALSCFEKMQCEGISPDAVTFTCILKACSSLKAIDKGEKIHEEIAKKGLLGINVVLGNALVDMYAKCDSLAKAWKVLEELPARNVISWNALIAGYAHKGEGVQALSCFEKMQEEGLPADAVTFTCILKACGSIGAVDKGARIHDEISKQGLLENDVMLGNALVDMYAKCGALTKARRVLKELPVRAVISWTALIAGYAKQGEGEEALECFEQMQHEGIHPNGVTFICVLRACGIAKALERGEKIHDQIARQGLLSNSVLLGTALVDMYAKCGVLAKARRVIMELPVRNVVCWNALIAGYVQQGSYDQALECLEELRQDGLSANGVTFTCVLKACGCIKAADKGEEIHNEIAKEGLLPNSLALGNALVDMYSKCGTLSKARGVLEELPVRDAITWSSLIAGYAQQGEGQEALNSFERMQSEGLSPDAVTFTCLLKACGSARAAEKGERILEEIVKQGLLETDVVLGNALVDMFIKCGALTKAQQVLDELPARDVVSWNTLLVGYTQEGEGSLVLECYKRMQREGISPDEVTLSCALKACGSTGATDMGTKIHDEIVNQGLLRENIVLSNAIVDMYAKCGALTKARLVLEELSLKNVISWNTLISGYAQHCQGSQALDCFAKMLQEGLVPDAATFSCLLNACSRSGLVEEIGELFVTMTTQYGLRLDLDHYNCMMDLFGRAGHLDMAVVVIKKMPPCDSGVWLALLGACGKWGDVNVGKWAFEQAVQADKNDGAAYALMAKVYAAAGMQEEVQEIQSVRISSGQINVR